MDVPIDAIDNFSLHKIIGADCPVFHEINDIPVSIRRGGINSPISSPILKKNRPSRNGISALDARRVRWDLSTDLSKRTESKKFHIQHLIVLIASIVAVVIAVPCVYYLIFL